MTGSGLAPMVHLVKVTNPGLPRWVYIPASAGAAFVVPSSGRDGCQGRLDALLVIDHQYVVAVRPPVEPADRHRQHGPVSSARGSDGFDAGPRRGRGHSPAAADGAAATGPAAGGGRYRTPVRLRPAGTGGPIPEAAGIRIAFTTTAVVLAQRSYRCRSSSSLSKVPPEHPALTTTWWRRPSARARPPCGGVSLPLLAPGLVSGAVLAFARSLGEFGAPSRSPGPARGHQDAPLEVYLQRESDPTPRSRSRSCPVRRRRPWCWALGLDDSRHGTADERRWLICSSPRRQGRGPLMEFSVAAGEVLAILGPNGAGSRLRCTSSRACCGRTPARCWWAVAH